jgi:hypothetical protein
LHGTPLPVGLFIPFEKAWLAVKEFMETDGKLPKSIDWIENDNCRPERFRRLDETRAIAARAKSLRECWIPVPLPPPPLTESNWVRTFSE